MPDDNDRTGMLLANLMATATRLTVTATRGGDFRCEVYRQRLSAMGGHVTSKLYRGQTPAEAIEAAALGESEFHERKEK